MALSQRNLGIAYTMFSILVWSGWMVISSHGVRGTLTAYDITALRFATAGILFLPVLLKKGLRIGPYGVWGGIWLALAMGAAYNTICILGMKYAPTSHTSIIQTTVLLLTTIGGVYLLRERLTRLQCVGILLSVLGIACLVEAGGTPDNPTMWLGNLLFFCGGVMWSAYTLSLRAWKADPLQVAAAVCCVSALIYMPIYWLFLPSQLGLHNLGEAGFQAFYQGLINSVFALISYNRAVKLLGAGATSAFLPLIPIIASLMAMPLLGEIPTLLEWTGIATAAVGVLLATGVAGRMLKRA